MWYNGYHMIYIATTYVQMLAIFWVCTNSRPWHYSIYKCKDGKPSRILPIEETVPSCDTVNRKIGSHRRQIIATEFQAGHLRVFTQLP